MLSEDKREETEIWKGDLTKQLEIRHDIERTIKDLGGVIEGAGTMMTPPYTADICFTLGGRRYNIDLTELV